MTSHLSKIIDIIRALAYLVIGCYLLVNNRTLSTINPIFKNVLAIILLLYGTYRLYQVYIKHFRRQQDENA